MDLEQLQARSKEIDDAIVNMSAQLNALHGHKTEVSHWIQQLQNSEQVLTEAQVEPLCEPMLQ